MKSSIYFKLHIAVYCVLTLIFISPIHMLHGSSRLSTFVEHTWNLTQKINDAVQKMNENIQKLKQDINKRSDSKDLKQLLNITTTTQKDIINALVELSKKESSPELQTITNTLSNLKNTVDTLIQITEHIDNEYGAHERSFASMDTVQKYVEDALQSMQNDIKQLLNSTSKDTEYTKKIIEHLDMLNKNITACNRNTEENATTNKKTIQLIQGITKTLQNMQAHINTIMEEIKTNKSKNSTNQTHDINAKEFKSTVNQLNTMHNDLETTIQQTIQNNNVYTQEMNKVLEKINKRYKSILGSLIPGDLQTKLDNIITSIATLKKPIENIENTIPADFTKRMDTIINAIELLQKTSENSIQQIDTIMSAITKLQDTIKQKQEANTTIGNTFSPDLVSHLENLFEQLIKRVPSGESLQRIIDVLVLLKNQIGTLEIAVKTKETKPINQECIEHLVTVRKQLDIFMQKQAESSRVLFEMTQQMVSTLTQQITKLQNIIYNSPSTPIMQGSSEQIKIMQAQMNNLTEIIENLQLKEIHKNINRLTSGINTLQRTIDSNDQIHKQIGITPFEEIFVQMNQELTYIHSMLDTLPSQLHNIDNANETKLVQKNDTTYYKDQLKKISSSLSTLQKQNYVILRALTAKKNEEEEEEEEAITFADFYQMLKAILFSLEQIISQHTIDSQVLKNTVIQLQDMEAEQSNQRFKKIMNEINIMRTAINILEQKINYLVPQKSTPINVDQANETEIQ